MYARAVRLRDRDRVAQRGLARVARAARVARVARVAQRGPVAHVLTHVQGQCRSCRNGHHDDRDTIGAGMAARRGRAPCFAGPRGDAAAAAFSGRGVMFVACFHPRYV